MFPRFLSASASILFMYADQLSIGVTLSVPDAYFLTPFGVDRLVSCGLKVKLQQQSALYLKPGRF
jgi:hypothetical protein